MISRRLILPLAALAVLAVAVPAAHAFAGRNGEIVYGWSQTDEPELGPFSWVKAIRLISPRGGEPRTAAGCAQTLPPTAAEPARTCMLEVFADPAVSRDRERIVFDNGAALALVDPDGSDLQALPQQGADDGEPALSAAGGRVVFSTGPAAGSGERGLMIRNLATGAVRELLDAAADPAWSARNWIAFERNGGVWIVRPGGRDLQRLTRSGSEPAWSPRGTKLAFVRGRTIRVLDLGSRRVRTLARNVSATDLAWSPDGRRLAYTVFDAGVETIRTDGTRPRVVVQGGVNASSSLHAVGVDWAPRR